VNGEMNQPGDFDEALRRWAGRPPATSATDAARAVVARLQAAGGRQGFSFADRRRFVRLSPAWATLLAAVLVLVAGTAWFIRSLPPVATGLKTGVATGLGVPNAAAALGAPLKTGGPTMVPARDADVVLWLDEGTPVHVFLPGDGPAMR
jgi:hypothetical protein